MLSHRKSAVGFFSDMAAAIGEEKTGLSDCLDWDCVYLVHVYAG